MSSIIFSLLSYLIPEEDQTSKLPTLSSHVDDTTLPKEIDALILRLACTTLKNVSQPKEGFQELKNDSISEMLSELEDIKKGLLIQNDGILKQNFHTLRFQILEKAKENAVHALGNEARSWADCILKHTDHSFEYKLHILEKAEEFYMNTQYMAFGPDIFSIDPYGNISFEII